MAAANSKDVSLWLLVGLPLGLTLIAQLGALGVAWLTTGRSRDAEHQRYLVAERRGVFSAHLTALEALREAAVVTLRNVYAANDMTTEDFDRLSAASREYDAAANEALLLGNSEYEDRTEDARAAVAKIEIAIMRIKARADGMPLEMAEPELAVDDVVALMTTHAITEVSALRATARRQLHAHN